MRALVTGHLGFVGTHLCRELVKRGCKVIGIDLKNGADIVSCDLPDAEKVFHLAGQTDAQCEDVGKDAAVNIAGSIRVFERYRDKAVFASSSMVMYPVAPYAISKGAAEDYARYYGAAVVRFCNLYGEGGHSVIDRFREADALTVYGTGEQLRTYEHVDVAVQALINARPGKTTILPGDDYTVNEIAAMFPGKPVSRGTGRHLDLIDARQIGA
jgi:nucleoside-diphosphate-sugar epimerase